MYPRITLAILLVLVGVVRASSESHIPGLLRRRSVHPSTSRHSVVPKPLSRIARNAHLLRGLLEVRADGCPSGYDPCLGDEENCCPPGCLPCSDDESTCCDAGTFCATDDTGLPVCQCLGDSCPSDGGGGGGGDGDGGGGGGGGGSPDTSTPSIPTPTAKFTKTATFSGPATNSSTSTTRFSTPTQSVGFSSTTPLGLSSSSVAALPSATTANPGSSSGNAGGGTLSGAVLAFKPPLLLVLGVGAFTLVIEHGFGFLG